jgi:lipoprotein-releasing system permease protein
MRFELFIAWRFLKEAKVQTLLTLLAITIGVGVQVFLSSLITGLQTNLLEATVGNSAHISIVSKTESPASMLIRKEGKELLVFTEVNWNKKDKDLSNWQPIVAELREYPDITAVSPIVNESAFLQRGGANRAVLIKGIIPQDANNIYKYQSNMLEGEVGISGSNDILLGRGLAEDLNLEVGDSIQLSSARGNQGTFRIKGVFDLKVNSLNSSWIFMELGRAQSFLQKNGNVSKIELQISEVFASEALASRLSQKWPDLTIETWQTSNRQLLSGLKSQSSSSLVIQFFVQLAVLLGISSVLAVAVVQKARLIGILKAMGLRNQRVGRIFIYQGGLLGVIGSFLGCISGYLLIRAFLFFTGKGGAEVSFDVPFEPYIFLTGAAVAVLASILAAFLPARRASSYNPIEVIRIG